MSGKSGSRGYSRNVLLVVAVVLVALAVVAALGLGGFLAGVVEPTETTFTTTVSVERPTTIKETVVQTVERTSVSTVKATETMFTTVTTTATTEPENWVFGVVKMTAEVYPRSAIWKVNNETAGIQLLMRGNYTSLSANMSLMRVRIVGPGIDETLVFGDLVLLLPHLAALPPPGKALILNATIPDATVVVGEEYQVMVDYSREGGAIHRAVTWTEDGLVEECWLVCSDRPPRVP